MENAKVNDYKGKEIFFIDISNCNAMEILKRMKAVEQEIVKYPENSLYVLTNSTKIQYNSITSSTLKEFSDNYTKYIKCSAMVDEDGIHEQELNAVSKIEKQSMKPFTNINDALEWLITQ